MMRTVSLLALCLAPFAAAAEDYAHCYLNEAPARAPAWTELPAPMLTYSDELGAATLRVACGDPVDVHRDALFARLERVGCSATSEIANLTVETLETEVIPLKDLFMSRLSLDDDGFADACSSLETCIPDANMMYSDACLVSLDKVLEG